jgi:drug/metabolite transporter (DMT)-like permease
MSITTRASLALLLVTMIWGATFVWMKQGGEAARALYGTGHDMKGIAVFLSIRFLLAAVLLYACSPASRKDLASRGPWIGGLILGTVLYVGFALQMRGLSDLSPATSAFLTSLYVGFTALMVVTIHRRGLNLWLTGGVVLASVGAAFISGPPQVSFDLPEWITVACALLFAVHILLTDRITKSVEPGPVTFTSFLVVGALAGISYPLASMCEPDASHRIALDVLRSWDFLKPLLLSCVLATVLALSLMNQFQRDISPVRAAIIYAIEPIWATLYSIMAGIGIEAPGWFLFGALALLLGNLVAELGPRVRKRRKAHIEY